MDASVMRLFHSRDAAHKEFDMIWKEGLMSRDLAYFFLQYLLGELNPAKAHFAILTPTECASIKEKIRKSYTLPSFYRFIDRVRYPQREIKKTFRTARKMSDPLKPKLRYCTQCRTWKDKELFSTKKKKICDECRWHESEHTDLLTLDWEAPEEFMKLWAQRNFR